MIEIRISLPYPVEAECIISRDIRCFTDGIYCDDVKQTLDKVYAEAKAWLDAQSAELRWEAR